jgi:hypothetical protein
MTSVSSAFDDAGDEIFGMNENRRNQIRGHLEGHGRHLKSLFRDERAGKDNLKVVLLTI